MKLKEYLRKNKIKQISFATKMGISKAHLSMIVNSKRVPSSPNVYKIKCETGGLVCIEDYFTDEEGNPIFVQIKEKVVES